MFLLPPFPGMGVHIHALFAQTTVTKDIQQGFSSICFTQCTCGTMNLE
jgi:hypothetical protein